MCGGDGDCGEPVDSYYSVELESTGVSQLTILSDSITSLEVGDEIGVFDAEAITNYNDCSNQIGELLVGAGVWTGEQLNLVSIGSNDLCSFGGAQFAGFVEGNDVIIKVYRASEDMEYATELTWGAGSGVFGDIIQSVSEMTLVDPNACADDDAAVAGFGGCAGAVAALGCDFVFGGTPVSELCPVSCDNCPEASVPGCTDVAACNYDESANEDDGSCEYPTGCDEECGSTLEFDECGVCGGDGIADGACDCDGNVDLGCGCGEAGPSGCDEECGSTLEFDECGVCGGDGIAEGACDCDGNVDLGCGCGEAGPSGCDEECGSTLEFDECGVCDGDNSSCSGCTDESA